MREVDHRQRALTLEQTIRKIDPSCFEHIIEGAVLAGTHWLNIAMHASGITQPDEDVMHAEFLSLAMFEKIELIYPSLANNLLQIENMRAPYVRGNEPAGERAAKKAIILLSEIKKSLQNDIGH